MTQVVRPQDKLVFPDPKFVQVRQSLASICFGLRSAGKLLSVLLYKFMQDDNTTAEQTTYVLQRTQKKIIEDLCGELNAKTLHDAAVPALVVLGYADIEISTYIHTYTLHLDQIKQALALVKNPKELEKFLIARMDQQLEKLLIVIPETIRESSNYNKKKFQLLLEKSLIVIRESSNSVRGRKPRQEAASNAQNAKPQTYKTYKDSVDFFTGATFRSDDEPSTDPSPDKKNSYSQEEKQPTEEKENWFDMKAELTLLDAQLDGWQSLWLSENKAHQSTPSQETVTLPEKPAPMAVYKPEPPMLRPQTAAQIAKERSQIERHIWKLLDTEAGAKIGRVFTQPMADLVTSYMDGEYVDDDFIQSVKLVRKQKIKMSFTNIVNGMADAVTERKKIIQFPTANKPKSFEEREAERIIAEQEFEAKQKAGREARLAREAQGRMATV